MAKSGASILALLLPAFVTLSALSARGVDTNAAAAGIDGAYHLLPSDKVRFWIEEDPKGDAAATDLPVTSLNMILFPVSRGYELTIPINVVGKTIDQVKTELTAKLEEKYYKTATVHLTLLTQTQRRGLVYFNDQITGTLELLPGDQMTVTQAILKKGYNDYANLKKVTIKRTDPVTKKTVVMHVNVKALLEKPDPAKDVILQDKDIVDVPQRGIIF
jgi:protein involved in polysaccharide export with SLBB domain